MTDTGKHLQAETGREGSWCHSPDHPDKVLEDHPPGSLLRSKHASSGSGQESGPLPELSALQLNFRDKNPASWSCLGQCVLAIGSHIHPSYFTRDFIRWPKSKQPPCCWSWWKNADLTLGPDPRWNLSLTHRPWISFPIVWKPISKLFS